jgi:hypothetical protein
MTIADIARIPSVYDFNYTEDEAATGLGKAKLTLRKMRRLRQGPPWVRNGKDVLYPKDQFLAYLQNLGGKD